MIHDATLKSSRASTSPARSRGGSAARCATVGCCRGFAKLEFWSQEVVEEALGAELAEALPELLRLTDLEVRIPRMEVVALERLAALDGETVSAVLARELRDLVSVHSEWLSQEVPGFAEALAWPETPLVTSPRGGGAVGAPDAKQATSGDEPRGRTPRRSDDAGRKTEAAIFSLAARCMPAADVDAVIH